MLLFIAQYIFFFLILFYYLTLQYCIDFAIYQHYIFILLWGYNYQFYFFLFCRFTIVAKIVQSALIYLQSFSLKANIFHKHYAMIKTKKLTLIKYYKLNYRLHSDFTRVFFFSSNVFYLFQNSTQHLTIMPP